MSLVEDALKMVNLQRQLCWRAWQTACLIEPAFQVEVPSVEFQGWWHWFIIDLNGQPISLHDTCQLAFKVPNKRLTANEIDERFEAFWQLTVAEYPDADRAS